IYKMCGYANLYIGTAEHEGDRPADQVTMSIFRATKPIRLFKRLEKNGMLARGDVPGIYRVTGITNLPFQIVVTNELEGDQYAAYRAMTENAKKNDVERVIEDSGAELDEVIREHYHTLLKLVVEKNPKYIDVVKGVEDMEDILLEMVKDRVDEKVNEKVNEKEQETKISDIKGVMESFGVSVDRAMDALKIPASQRSKYAGLIRKGM
ncbi:MAG: hypothetical protein J5819_04225, partial [Eubacterium sp.]|nr:hypothetical protein [Eubacterium sp.]